ncbi:MAG: hypothetical protein IJT20_01810, partial [Synergistaceae bacterium]|nr:hypothetical protein [Synergistaceae bacterium]
FEKKIEQSLNVESTFKAPSKNQAKIINNNDELGIITPKQVGIRSEELGGINEPAQEISEEPKIIDVPIENSEVISEIETTPEQEENLLPEQELPEIPLIEDENQEEGNLPDIPVISAEEDYEDVEEVSENENKSLPETFSPSADVVLNVAEEIPQAQETAPSPEGEAVPVSVAMPETTKTAEDKLMADIAEAMTGNPLTLETREAPEPYKLPENFLNEAGNNNDPSRQSAEEKLIANIAQAMSESPLEAAQNNAAQNLEEEINNLDFIPSFPDHEERLTEEFDFSQYEEDTPEEAGVRSEEAGGINEPAQEIIEEPEIVDTPEENSEPVVIDETEEQQKEPEEFEELGVSNEELGIIEEPAENSETISEIETTPEQEENLLPPASYLLPENTEELQEKEMPEQTLIEENKNEDIEDVSTELSPESNFEDIDNADDFDVNLLGALGAAASVMPDYDEPVEEFSREPEQNYEDSSFDDGLGENMPTLNDVIINPEEEKDKEKIMGIREKMAGRKDKSAKENLGDSKKKKISAFSGGIFTPLLLISLLAVGGFIAWQLMQLNDKLTGSLMNMGMSAGTFDAVPAEKNPSYDYAIDFIFDTNLSARMAQRGKEGWQVVGSRRTQDSITGQLGYEFIFMRKTPGK